MGIIGKFKSNPIQNGVFTVLVFAASVSGLALAYPADDLRRPRSEACIPFDPDPEEGEMIAPEGLNYNQVTLALNKVIQHALYCEQPDGYDALNLTFELTVGCNGIVSEIIAVDDDGAPEDYVTCVSDVIRKADFPAHDMENGMPVTYPVNVAW
jgi:hypothetical protein